MKITSIILIHDDEISCKKKKCKHKGLITPINLDGEWSCPKCNKYFKVCDIDKDTLAKSIQWTG